MNCNCRWCELILGLVILVVTIWPGIIGATASMWVVIIGAALLVLHSLFHHKCGCGMCMEKMPAKAKKSKRKRR